MPFRLSLLLLLFGLLISPLVRADVLQPATVVTTSYWLGTSGGDPIHLIDGSGLSVGGPVQTRTHDNDANATTMWHAGNVVGALGGPAGTPPLVADQAVVFDLGGLVDLGGAFIWNHNQAPALSRGVDQFEILVSADSDPLTATYTSLGNYQLAQAGGTAAEPAQLVVFAASQVRLVKFDIQSAHSGLASDYVGLSEVRFAPPLANLDTDVDGLSDAFELAHGFDRLVADEDVNGTVDGQDDTDSDGLGNAAEERAGTDPNDPDSDDDGLLDGQELGQGVFGAQQVITTTANGVQSVVGADVDGDGDLDVLSASQVGDEIAWYENTDGAGSFGAKQVITSTADGATTVFAADIDGDGDLDALSASFNDDTVAWYENTDGAGSFGAEQVISSIANSAFSVHAADLDGDGDVDVLSASAADATIGWYQNTDGAGTFGARQVLSAASSGAFSVHAFDADGDGDLDVLAGSRVDDTVAWFENTDGAGGFGAEQFISTTADFVQSVFAADLDGDGDADVLSASSLDDTIAWYENTDGAGSFGAAQVVSSTADGAASVRAADVDGDGDIDILATSGGDDTLAWFENTDGAGSFAAAQVLSSTANGAASLVAGDVDGDGDLDLLSGSSLDDTIAWYENVSTSDPSDPDTDDDGLLDGFEVTNGFDPLVGGEENQDPDADGLDNLAEQAADTDPNDADSDDDGLLDGFELANGFDPLDSDENGNGIVDGQDDTDVDGVGNAAEALAGTNPNDADSDDDGLLDGDELGQGTFGSEQIVSSTADGASSVFAVDVDGDGDIDLLSASSFDDTIAWYENADGAGSFGAAQIISATADSAQAVFAADVDGDGDLDALSASYNDNTIAWYENTDGAGSFGPEQFISTTAFGARSVAAADLDGDGDVDALAGHSDGTVAWYENTDGAGSFGLEQAFASGTSIVAMVAAADVDGDGDLDALAALVNDHELTWYENTDGAGTFGPEQVISSATSAPQSIFSADLDGDGDLDALSASSVDDRIAWHENSDGAGDFGGPLRPIAVTADNATSAVAADLDGDGDLDAISASQDDDKIAWYENLSTSDPNDPDTDDDGLLDGFEVSYGFDPLVGGDESADPDGDDLDNLAEQAAGTNPLLDDSDGDGLFDGFELANGFDPLVGGDGGLDPDGDLLDNLAEQAIGTDPNDADSDDDGLADGLESGTGFGPLQIVSVSGAFPNSTHAADLDGDGDPDALSALNSDNTIAWYENSDGLGTFGTPQVLSSTSVQAFTVVAADVDGDMDLDVLGTSLGDDTLAWFENTDGAGSFGPEQVISSIATGAAAIFAADLDGDGDIDVVASHAFTGTLAWYENTDGAGSFGVAQNLSTTSGGVASVVVADLDGDEDLDVVAAASADDKIEWFENTDGAGSFGAAQLLSVTALDAADVRAADVDGDGDLDVIAASFGDDTLAWYENTDGAGSFGPEQVISSTSIQATSVRAADIDRDGDLDVFLGSAGDDTIAWFENTDGSGSFGPRQVITTTAAGVRGLSVADFDGDGDPDVLAAVSSANTIAWYENLLGTDPLDPDTDDDGLLDGFEVTYGFDPYDADENLNATLDGQDDADADGLDNADEQFYGTHPGVLDTDGDGFGDGLEILEGTDPLDEFDFPVQAVPSADLWAMTLLITTLLTVGVRRFARPNDV